MNTYKFKKLEVWQKSMVLVTHIYSLTTHFPAHERFGLTDQLRRAAISISLNIAEGSGAGSDVEYSRFLRIAQRSAFEVIAGLEIAINLQFTSQSAIEDLVKECDSISAMLGGLIKKIKLDNLMQTAKSEKLTANSGFTLIELLVVVTVIVVLSVIGMVTFSEVRTKAQDTIRKNDLQTLAQALELYYQKNSAYPTPTTPSNDCSSDVLYANNSFSPLISGAIPIDPETKARYCYISIDGGKGYRLYATLKKCTPSANSLCQFQNNNYSLVSEGNTVAAAPGSVTVPKEKPLSCELYGDLDRNGKITTSDAVRIEEIDATMDQIPDEIKYLADVSGDNEVTSLDSLMVNRYLIGTDSVMKRVCENARPSPCNGIGDITGDGKITPVDMFEASLIALGESNSFYTQAPYTNTQRQNADVNGNGMDITDALDIIRYYKKEINTFSACPL